MTDPVEQPSQVLDDVESLRRQLHQARLERDTAIQWAKQVESEREVANDDLASMLRTVSIVLNHPGHSWRAMRRLLSERDRANLDEVENDKTVRREVEGLLAFHHRVSSHTGHVLGQIGDTFAEARIREMATLPASTWIRNAADSLRKEGDFAEFSIRVDDMPDLTADRWWMSAAIKHLMYYALTLRDVLPKQLRFGGQLTERGWVGYVTDSEDQVKVVVPVHARRWPMTRSAEFACFARIVFVHGGVVWEESTHSGSQVIYFLIPQNMKGESHHDR